MRKKLVFGFLALLNTACAFWVQTITIEELPTRQDWQSQASVISVQSFFDYRMQNRMRKAPVGNWMIVHETQDDVFLAYPRFKSLLSDQREAKNVFKISKTQLESEFPAWKSLDGETLHSFLQGHFRPQTLQSWQADLESESILIQGKFTDNTAFELKIRKQLSSTSEIDVLS